jgi:ABC-type Fe3+ transport system permease subunit
MDGATGLLVLYLTIICYLLLLLERMIGSKKQIYNIKKPEISKETSGFCFQN